VQVQRILRERLTNFSPLSGSTFSCVSARQNKERLLRDCYVHVQAWRFLAPRRGFSFGCIGTSPKQTLRLCRHSQVQRFLRERLEISSAFQRLYFWLRSCKSERSFFNLSACAPACVMSRVCARVMDHMRLAPYFASVALIAVFSTTTSDWCQAVWKKKEKKRTS